jgi:hypothetical protein
MCHHDHDSIRTFFLVNRVSLIPKTKRKQALLPSNLASHYSSTKTVKPGQLLGPLWWYMIAVSMHLQVNGQKIRKWKKPTGTCTLAFDQSKEQTHTVAEWVSRVVHCNGCDYKEFSIVHGLLEREVWWHNALYYFFYFNTSNVPKWTTP